MLLRADTRVHRRVADLLTALEAAGVDSRARCAVIEGSPKRLFSVWGCTLFGSGVGVYRGKCTPAHRVEGRQLGGLWSCTWRGGPP